MAGLQERSTASVSEEFAAESAIKMLTIADAKDISYYLFSLKNMGSDINNVEHNWGILNRDSTPKLSLFSTDTS